MDYQKALDLLGALHTDDEKTLKDKYYAKMREVHPDHGGSTEATIEIQTAYNTVLEPPLTELESILFDMISLGNDVTFDEVKYFFKRITTDCTHKIVSLREKHKAIERSSQRFNKSTTTFKKKLDQELSKLSHQIAIYIERRDSIEKIKEEFEKTYTTPQEIVNPAFPPKINSLWIPT